MPRRMIDQERRRTGAVAALFVALTLIATYPIARAPASYAFFSHSDAQLNAWILAWDAHAIGRDPANLFNANIFAPERGTLAYSETLLGYLPLSGIILWLNGSPALAFNAVLLWSFTASALAMYLLARHLTGRPWPAIVAAIVYAFTPYRFAHIPQIQLESMEWMPLAFLGLHLFIERREFKYAAGVGACIAMQALCCLYYAVFLVIALLVATPILLFLDRRPQPLRALGTLALVGCVTAIALAPIGIEYLHVSRTQGLERTVEEMAVRSADASALLASPARLHLRLWAHGERQPRDYLFPGLVSLTLAVVGVATAAMTSAPNTESAPHRRRSVVLAYAAVAAVGLWASLGPDGLFGLSLFRVLYAAGPLVHGLRQVSRFAVLGLFGASVLAAVGAAMLESLTRRFATIAMAALACVAFLELLVAPLTADRPGGEALVRVPPVPPVYEWLARQPGRFAILELPVAPLGRIWENGSYVYWSTVHWKELVDGYSGFAPPWYADLARTVASFPDERSHEMLTARNVRYVVVHHDRYRSWNAPLNLASIARTPWLRELQQFPGVTVLAMAPAERIRTNAHNNR